VTGLTSNIILFLNPQGYETTSTALQFLLFLLALHPHHQELCRKEVDALFEGRANEELEYGDMNKLKYLEMCLNESHRILPTVFIILRHITAPLQIGKFDGVFQELKMFFTFGTLLRVFI